MQGTARSLRLRPLEGDVSMNRSFPRRSLCALVEDLEQRTLLSAVLVQDLYQRIAALREAGGWSQWVFSATSVLEGDKSEPKAKGVGEDQENNADEKDKEEG